MKRTDMRDEGIYQEMIVDINTHVSMRPGPRSTDFILCGYRARHAFNSAIDQLPDMISCEQCKILALFITANGIKVRTNNPKSFRRHLAKKLRQAGLKP